MGDDYNWDWSLVHLMAKEELPFKVLSPGVLQVAHIGLEDGMHTNQEDQNFIGLTTKQEMLHRMKKYLNKNGNKNDFLKGRVPKKQYTGKRLYRYFLLSISSPLASSVIFRKHSDAKDETESIFQGKWTEKKDKECTFISLK